MKDISLYEQMSPRSQHPAIRNNTFDYSCDFDVFIDLTLMPIKQNRVSATESIVVVEVRI